MSGRQTSQLDFVNAASRTHHRFQTSLHLFLNSDCERFRDDRSLVIGERFGGLLSSSCRMPSDRFVDSIEEAEKRYSDVLVIGSGPAATAATEHLMAESNATITILERGDLVTTTHLANFLSFERRRSFVEIYGEQPWDGDFVGGRLIHAVGGRGIAAGGLLRRLDPEDFSWLGGEWPFGHAELAPYYELAEHRRRVSIRAFRGPIQVQVLGRLQSFLAYTPPVGVDFSLSKPNRGYDSSVARLWKLNLEDSLDAARENRPKRLVIAPCVVAARLLEKSGRVEAVQCYSRGSKHSVSLSSRVILCAASTIESARLALHSGIGGTATGRYLAEHIGYRGEWVAPWPSNVQGDFEVLIPPGAGAQRRFQVQAFGGIRDDGNLHFTLVGFAAMDPCEDNRVVLDSQLPDEYGVPRAFVHAKLSSNDRSRAKLLEQHMTALSQALGASAQTLSLQPLGASYHEAGTLRMGADRTTSVTDNFGKFHDIDNLYAADASVFPSVGVANPMLTITALAYRQADEVIAKFQLRDV